MFAKKPPAIVREAIRDYVPMPGFKVIPPTSQERSFIFYWGGVRVQCAVDSNGKILKPGDSFADAATTQVGWICLADASCRSAKSYHLLSCGKTSRATKHLNDVHKIASDKIQAETSRKVQREEDAAKVLDSQLLDVSPGRTRILLETLRIVYNNLPFRLGEYKESQLINDVAIKDNLQVVSITSAKITHAIAELYASTKREIMLFLEENRVSEGVPCFTIVRISGLPSAGIPNSLQ